MKQRSSRTRRAGQPAIEGSHGERSDERRHAGGRPRRRADQPCGTCRRAVELHRAQRRDRAGPLHHLPPAGRPRTHRAGRAGLQRRVRRRAAVRTTRRAPRPVATNRSTGTTRVGGRRPADPRDRAPRGGPRRHRRPCGAGRLDVPPLRTRLEPGRRTPALLVAGQGALRLRLPAPAVRPTRGPHVEDDHHAGGAHCRARHNPPDACRDHRRRARDGADRHRRPGGGTGRRDRGPRGLGSHRAASGTGRSHRPTARRPGGQPVAATAAQITRRPRGEQPSNRGPSPHPAGNPTGNPPAKHPGKPRSNEGRRRMTTPLSPEEILQRLYDETLAGNAPDVLALTHQALELDMEPQSLLFDSLIPSLEEVGARFERGDFFVPEMLIAGRAMAGAMEVLRPLLADTGVETIGKFLMGTVKGDVHDIGKNLVNIMLEGAGFEVIDLGVQVAPEKFVEKIIEHKPDIVGFSAFLTTTMPMFKANINALQKAGLREQVIVMVGGAPVTQEYADAVGADGYAPDASATVKRAKDLLQTKRAKVLA